MNKPHKRDAFNVCGAWTFYQLSKTGLYNRPEELGTDQFCVEQKQSRKDMRLLMQVF